MKGSFRTHGLRTSALDVPSGLGSFSAQRVLSVNHDSVWGDREKRGNATGRPEKALFLRQVLERHQPQD